MHGSPIENNRQRLKTTVVIPTLNEEAYLGQCLSSLATHGGDLIDAVIVVDAGSTDNTKSIAERGGAQFLAHPKSTIAAQRNAGAAIAKTELLAFLDADCTIAEGWSEAAASEFEDARIASAGAPPDIPDAANTWVQRTWSFIKRKPRGSRQNVKWIASANVWVRKSTFDEIDGFNESFETCEDADLGYRLSERGAIISNPAIRVQHHREPRTLREFYRKEVWHGKNSFDGIAAGRFSKAEIPSLITPILFCVSALLCCSGVIFWSHLGPSLTIVGLAGCFLAPVAYTLRAILTKGHVLRTLQVLALYCVYFTARADAFLRWCGRLPFRQ